MRTISIIVGLMTGCIFVCPIRLCAQVMNPYGTAPPLTISKWVQGPPIGAFMEGHVYLVGFSTMGCPPCRKAIPKLDELAKRYAKELTVVSVYVNSYPYSEKDTANYGELAAANKKLVSYATGLVGKLGNGISYAVGVDDVLKRTSRDWDVIGTPIFFLVDKDNKMVWSGSDINEIALILPAVLNGTFDRGAAIQRRMGLQTALGQIRELDGRKDHRAALQMVDSLLLSHPWKYSLYISKFLMLAKIDSQRANSYLAWMFDNMPLDFVWDGMAAKLLSYVSEPDYGLAVRIADRNIELAETEIDLINTHKAKAILLGSIWRRRMAGCDQVNFERASSRVVALYREHNLSVEADKWEREFQNTRERLLEQVGAEGKCR